MGVANRVDPEKYNGFCMFCLIFLHVIIPDTLRNHGQEWAQHTTQKSLQ